MTPIHPYLRREISLTDGNCLSSSQPVAKASQLCQSFPSSCMCLSRPPSTGYLDNPHVIGFEKPDDSLVKRTALAYDSHV